MKILTRIFLIIFWVVLALVLAATGTLVCGVRLLTPERLTPIVEHFANRALDAEVGIGRVELGFKPKFPLLYVQVDSLTIVSHAFDGLSDGQRAGLPDYADSLLSVRRVSGALDIMAYLRQNIFSLHRVEIDGAGINVVMSEDGRGNFDIYNSDGGPDTAAIAEPFRLPRIALDRFTFTDPKEMRYFNALDSTEATVILLADAGVDGSASPTYRLNLSGRLNSPVARSLLSLEDVGFGLDGKIVWDPSDPSMISVQDCDVRSAFVSAKVCAGMRFDTTLVVNSAELVLSPISADDILSVVPADVRRKYSLVPGAFRTDATVAVDVRLTGPFVLGTDTIPHAVATVKVPECSMRYGAADFRTLALDLRAELKGNNPDSAVIELERFDVAGPATGLRVAGTVTNIATDAHFEGTVKGRSDLRRLPPLVADRIGGFISGLVTADIAATGDASMLAADRIHELDMRGTLRGDALYFLSNDTAKMVDVDRANLTFGTHNRVQTPAGTASAPLLTARVQVDTARILVNGVSMLVAALDLGVGTENSRPSADTTIVRPLGGGLKVGRFDVESVTDSAGMRLRGLLGALKLTRYKGNRRVPLITADFEATSLSAGTTDTRLLLRKAKIHASTYKLPSVGQHAKDVKKIADSLSRVHPDLPMDSVYRLAIAKRRRRPGEHRTPRVHGEMTDSDNEIIEWGLSKGFRKFLLGWHIDGTVETRSARLFMPSFPLRNRISHLDISFSNDTVDLRGVRYRAGRSDMAIVGKVSNIRRSLTSTTGKSRLKLNFDIVSDTLDVNQIASAVFAGAAYRERMRLQHGNEVIDLDGDESELDRQLDALVDDKPDKVGPLLVPTNIDARVGLKANNIHYSDLTMKGLSGDVLMYGGAINLHDLSASSDAGSLALSALYYAPKPAEMSFGFGLELDRIDIERFLNLVPAIDSVMPIMRDFSGIIDAELAATVDIDSAMNLQLPTLDAAVRIDADSLAFINPKTYSTLGKWLRFKDRNDNRVKHVNVEMVVRDNMLRIFPFEFDIDRYRLGIAGSNDLALNFNYHIAVLRSPLPFKFGINISGNPDKYKVRFGGARFKAGDVAESVNVVDTARVNLVRQIENVFRRGVDRSNFARLKMSMPEGPALPTADTELSPADSLVLIREGLIPDIKENYDETKDN